jgi:hypothetical protein
MAGLVPATHVAGSAALPPSKIGVGPTWVTETSKPGDDVEIEVFEKTISVNDPCLTPAL